MIKKMIYTGNLASTLLIRLMVGVVFISEGVQKFLFPAIRGAGRFEAIGLPNPEFLGYFVGTIEVLGGLLVLIGLLTRFASIPLLVIMSVALYTTKLPMFSLEGFWTMMHASRTDLAMTLGSLFLLVMGAGAFSFDRLLMRRMGKIKGRDFTKPDWI
ncbi:MAG: DoxX family protein [Bacteroides sp.]|nr:DoxX family protein [Bacteroides sp.]